MSTDISTRPRSPQELIRLLQQELEETNREVLILTTELDQRVEERTAQLMATQRELREKNAALERRTVQLEALNKELETFSYSVSHDLRAPLRHISGFTEALRQDPSSSFSDEARQYINLLVEAANRMSILIDDLLRFSRMSRASVRPAEFDMADLVAEVIHEMAGDLRGRNIQWNIQPMPAVSADRPLLKQVWFNLISNAVKYTRPRNPAKITIGCSDKTVEWEFFIADNGVGFDMAHATQLFGVFQRLHTLDEFEGTGIGLASVRQIISRHGGHTRAEAKLDRGATFYFTLPKSPLEGTED